jgi:hypothetical protein
MSAFVASMFVVGFLALMFFGSQWLVRVERQKKDEEIAEAELAKSV